MNVSYKKLEYIKIIKVKIKVTLNPFPPERRKSSHHYVQESQASGEGFWPNVTPGL